MRGGAVVQLAFLLLGTGALSSPTPNPTSATPPTPMPTPTPTPITTPTPTSPPITPPSTSSPLANSPTTPAPTPSLTPSPTSAATPVSTTAPSLAFTPAPSPAPTPTQTNPWTALVDFFSGDQASWHIAVVAAGAAVILGLAFFLCCYCCQCKLRRRGSKKYFLSDGLLGSEMEYSVNNSHSQDREEYSSSSYMPPALPDSVMHTPPNHPLLAQTSKKKAPKKKANAGQTFPYPRSSDVKSDEGDPTPAPEDVRRGSDLDTSVRKKGKKSALRAEFKASQRPTPMSPRVSIDKGLGGDLGTQTRCRASTASSMPTVQETAPVIGSLSEAQLVVSEQAADEDGWLSVDVAVDYVPPAPVGPRDSVDSVLLGELLTDITEAAGDFAIDYQRLKVVKPLGGGRFGEVVLAQYCDHEVAVKYFIDLHPRAVDPQRRAQALEVLKEELDPAREVRHSCLVNCIGIVTSPTFGVVTEYVAMGPLFTLLHEQKNALFAKWGNVCKLLAGAAQGLHCLHTNGMIHGEVTSANIMVTDHITAKIKGFGLARVTALTGLQFPPDDKTGSPGWMSPEMLRDDENITFHTDVYSLGCVMWELMMKKIPWGGLKHEEVCDLVLKDRLTLPIPNPLPEGLPSDYVPLMQALWSFSPQQRPSCGVIAMRLKAMV